MHVWGRAAPIRAEHSSAVPGLPLLTLRDGLQSPSVRDPSIAEKIAILHLMEALGINSLDLGLPGAGARAVESVEALAREIVRHKLKIKANCAARRVSSLSRTGPAGRSEAG